VLTARSGNIQKIDGLEIANSVFRIRFLDKQAFPKYGAKYWFELTDAIDDCPEYLVHFPSLQKRLLSL
jgi:mRNA (guanine-N7-)-methyltransferase